MANNEDELPDIGSWLEENSTIAEAIVWEDMELGHGVCSTLLSITFANCLKSS